MPAFASTRLVIPAKHGRHASVERRLQPQMPRTDGERGFLSGPTDMSICTLPFLTADRVCRRNLQDHRVNIYDGNRSELLYSDGVRVVS